MSPIVPTVDTNIIPIVRRLRKCGTLVAFKHVTIDGTGGKTNRDESFGRIQLKIMMITKAIWKKVIGA